MSCGSFAFTRTVCWVRPHALVWARRFCFWIDVELTELLRVLMLYTARLAQSAERKALNLVVVGSSPTVGVLFASAMLPGSRKGLRRVC